MQTQLLTRPEAAVRLRISLRKLDSLIASADLRATRIDGRVLVSSGEIERFIDAKTARRNPQISAEAMVTA